MIESNLKGGNQKLINKDTLEYGKSITDACINFEESISILRLIADSVKYKRNNYLST